MERFANLFEYIQPLTIFAKPAILGVSKGRCASRKSKEKLIALLFISYLNIITVR